jgi:hypothetical protein
MITPLEKNARRLIGVVAEHFPIGGTSEDLRIRFEKETFLARQSFYDALRYAKGQSWLVGGGGKDRLYVLNPDNSWKEPLPSIGEKQDCVLRDNNRLGYLLDSREEQIEELQDQVDDLHDWSSGGGSNAVEHLIKLLTGSATLRQKLKACSILLNYRSDYDTTAFARGFLEKVVSDPDTPVDYRLEGLEQLRRSQGDAMLRPPIERLTPTAPPIDREAEAEQRRIEFERKKAYVEAATAAIEREFGPQARSSTPPVDDQ